MTSAPSTFDLRGALLGIVPHVFQTMLSLAVKPGEPLRGERISGTIGIVGENLSGAVYVHFSESLAKRAASVMLSLDSADEPDHECVNDVASELANMIGGGLKSALCNAGWPCAMSTPSIIRGPAFTIELPQGLRADTFSFDCDGEPLAVEVHLNLE